VFRLDEGSVWSQVRRAPVANIGFTQLVLSDGTIFVRERDPANVLDERIVAYLPGGASQVVWREAEQTVVRSHGRSGLLVGPPCRGANARRGR
jgi:hypothetical protein